MLPRVRVSRVGGMLSFLHTRIPGRHGHEDGRALRSHGSPKSPESPEDFGSQVLVPFTAAAREMGLQEEMRENTRNIAAQAKAIQPKNTRRKYGAVRKECIGKKFFRPVVLRAGRAGEPMLKI